VKSDTPTYQVYLWPARGLVLAHAIRATLHRHEALQITLALDQPFRFRSKGGSWREAIACILDRGFAHEIDGGGGLQANLYLEPEGALGLVLSGLYLKKQPFAFIEPEYVKGSLPALKRGFAKGMDCVAAKRAYESVLASMVGPEVVQRKPESRVQKALDIFQALAEKRISAAELASQVALSESRLSHLFQQQLGIPIRRYLLWLKIVEAARQVNDPNCNVTDAAQIAGFTDSAHLTRSFRQLLGISPGMLFKNRDFVSVSCCNL
jgi:AraC-like DNA-binding protein